MGAMGKDKVTYGEHEVSISEISIIEKGGEEGPTDPVDPPAEDEKKNLLDNGDFSKVGDAPTNDGPAEGWQVWNRGSEDTFVVSENGLVCTIKGNESGEDWHNQLVHTISLEEGKKYLVKINVSSTVGRVINTEIKNTTTGDFYGPVDNDARYSWINGNESKTIEYTIDMTKSDDSAFFMMQIGDKIASTIVISDISIVDITDDESTEDVVEEIQDVQDEISVEDGEEPGKDEKEYKYTSGRISTQNNKTFKYGLFEVSAKVPKSAGYLPAFWLMANDENVYGQWPRCGEIDCMEVFGSAPNEVYGTIHYGNPHEQKQGKYKLKEGVKDFSEEFHTYSCEWNPDKITWYVDSSKYYETSNWFTKNEGDEAITYPAPFDQEFYIILNLAIGNNWAGLPDENTIFDNPFEVDYVRVLQKASYNENVKAPEEVFTPDHDADKTGNYIINGKFETNEELADEKDWVFKVANGGEAKASIDTSKNQIDVDIIAQGKDDYSVQLYQAKVPLEKGAKYELKFDAYADKARTMNVDIKAPDHGYSKYIETKNPALTTSKKTFKYEFTMNEKSDANARVEFNMGASKTDNIHITNVSVKKIADAPAETVVAKTVRPDGNYIYNGSFDQGEGRLGYWSISSNGLKDYSVSDLSDNRRLVLNASGVKLTQEDLPIKSGEKYVFSIEAESTTGNDKIDIRIGEEDYTINVNTTENQRFYVEIPSNIVYENKDLTIEFKNTGKLKVDNVRLELVLEGEGLIKNGDFGYGLVGYSPYVDSGASASYVVDSLKEDNALSVTVKNTGDADWKVQIKQENVKLEQGKKYRLKFDAKSTLNRKIRVIMQGGESLGYPVYSGENTVDVTSSWRTYQKVFVMEKETDPAAFLSICLGKVDKQIEDQHTVVIDNISLTEDTSSMSITPIEDQIYTGLAIKPALKIMLGEDELKEGVDYKLTYKNNVNVNKSGIAAAENNNIKIEDGIISTAETFNKKLPTITVTGIGNFSASFSLNFNIVQKDFSEEAKILTNSYIAYNKKGDTKVSYSVNWNGKKLATSCYTAELLPTDAYDAASKKLDSTKALTGLKIKKGTYGTFTLKVTGNGNYKGTVSTDIIVDKDVTPISSAKVSIAKINATGENVTVEAVKNAITSVKIGKTVLSGNGVDYDVEFDAVRDAGTYPVTLTGKGKYAGTKTVNVTIKGVDIKKATVSFASNSVMYNGTALSLNGLKLQMKNETTPLTMGADQDYVAEVISKDSVNVGTVKVKITGKGKYSGSVTKTYKITPYVINNGDAGTDEIVYSKSLGSVAYKAKGVAVTPSMAVKFKVGGEEVSLVEGKDYKLSYKDNKALTTDTKKSKVTITGIGNFKGKITDVTFDIIKTNFADTNAKIVAKDVVYSTKAGKYRVAPTLYTADGKKLTANTDYSKDFKYELVTSRKGKEDETREELTATSTPDAGSTIKVTVTGLNGYEGAPISIYYRVVTADINKAKISSIKKSYINSTTPVEIKATDIRGTIKVGKKTITLDAGNNFRIVPGTYKNNTKTGKATVEIEGIGELGGRRTITFTITKKSILNK